MPGVGSEYRIVVERPDELDVLTLEVEADDHGMAAVVAESVKLAIGLSPQRHGLPAREPAHHGVQVAARDRPPRLSP